MATPFETILNIGKNIVKTGKQAVTDAYSGTGAFAPDTGLGIARNTVLGTPKAFGTVANTAKEFLASNRGFELDSFMDYQKKLVSAKTPADKLVVKQNWQAQQPTFTESTKAPFKIGAEIASGLGNLAGQSLSDNPLYGKDSFFGRIAPSGAGKTLSDVAQTRVGGDFANLGKSIESFATAKTAGQAQAMKLADILSFFPMGTAKAVTKFPQTIKLARNTAVFDHLPVIEKALNEAQLVGKNIDLDALETIEKIKNYKINDLTDNDVKGVYEILARNGRQDIVESISKQISETPELRPAAPSKTELADQAKAIVKDGKKAVTEQPRDKVGRFDVKPKPTLSEELMGMSKEEKNLIVQHNINEAKILHAEKLGGLPIPSIAISNKNFPLENFGDISLIGKKDLIDPANKTNKVFNADVYSKRYPSVETIPKNIKPIQEAIDRSKGYFNNLDLPEWRAYDKAESMLSDIKQNGRSGIENDFATMRAFAADNKFDRNATRWQIEDYARAPENREAYQAFIDDLFEKIDPEERIFKGFTYSGRRRYSPVTIENVVREMKGAVKDTEGFNYGVPSLRASQAKQYRSLESIKADRKKIIPTEEMEAVKTSFDRRFNDLLDKHNINDLDAFTTNLKDYLRGKVSFSQLQEYQSTKGVDMKDFVKFADDLKKAPTEYFEAKPQRVVGLNEFTAAVVPNTVSKKVKDLLNSKGLKVVEYDPKIKGDRARVTGLAEKESQLAFGFVGGVEQDEEGKVSFDPLKAGLGFAGFTAFNRMKKIMPVDRLIAEGKIKINRVGTRDVYSYKKGNIWQRALDEDSAIRAVTKEPKAKPSLPENLVEKKISVEIAKEAIRDNPLNGLIKYTAKTGEFKGRLPEVLGGAGTRGFRQKGDDIIQSVTGRNIDSETARQELENFMERKQQVLAQEKAVNAEIKAFKASQTEVKTKVTPKVEASRPSSSIQAVTGSTGEIRSLEKMAEQSATKEILDPQLRKSSSLPKIIEKSTTNVKNKVNALDYLRTPDKVLKKIGLEKNADEIRRGYDAYVKELPKNIDKITEWSKRVSKEGNTKIFKYLDGEAIDLNPEELKVANEIKVYLAEWANRLGLPQDNRIANYITHLFDDQLIAKEFDEDLAKIIADKVPSSVYDPFLLKRLGAKGYKQDTWAALDAYVKRGTRKVHMDAPLANLEDASRGLEESQWNYVKRFADRINLRPTELDNIIDNGIKSFFGYRLGQRPVTTISRTLRQATYRGMLGLNVGSALRNLSQGVNTYAKLGEKYTVIGYSKLFSPKNLAELTEEGVLSTGFIQDRAMSSTKKFMEKADKVLFAMFDTAEKINRGAAYFGAKAKGIAEGMTEVKAIEYAKKTVRNTQFAFGSIDTPVGMSSDIVKTLTQFQTFTTKQIEFLAEMAKNKEYAGLIRYALSGIAFVYTVGQAFGMEPKDLAPIYRLGTPPSLKLPFEGLKAIVGAKDKYGNERTTGEKVQDVAGTLPGYIPAGIQAKKTIQGVQSIREGGVFDRANRLQFEGPQTKAQQIQAILFGRYASQKAKDYFNEADGKELEKIRPVYDQVQKLKEAGDIAGGQQVIDSLTDEEYEMYKKVKSSETTKKNAEIKKSIYPVFNNVQKLKASNKIDEAQKIIDGLTDDEYKAYQSIKKDNDNKPTTYDQPLVSRYAEAVVKDPSNALKALFTDEKLGKVEGNLVELQRFYGIKFTDKGGSQEYKQKRMQEMGLDWNKEKGNYKLEHIVPVSAGGDNSDSNLIPVNNTEHDVYTPVDIALGEAVKQGKITRKKATELAYGLKVSKVLSVEDIIKQLK